ncbi:MAG: iron-containing alcohol dehydrogenase family protein [bacterium]|nr:iron-containing alcohol dehydrogenase family protein [bacterium]
MMWGYLNPVKIIFGEGCISDIEKHLDTDRVLLVTDKMLAHSEILSRVEDALKNMDIVLFDKVQPNPSSYIVNACGKLAKDNNIEIILGVGGGSSIDTAKASAIVASTGIPIEEFLSGDRKIDTPCVPVLAIPTTSGTGSEVTPIAVITDEEKNKKQPIVSQYLFPKVAIVDPELTYSMPPEIAASTGMDALSHGIEGYWSKNSIPITDAFAIACVERVLRYLERSVRNRNDRNARREMSLASLLGGLTFAIPKTAAVHACSFPLTHRFGIPHGTACGLTLVAFIKFNYRIVQEKMNYLIRCTGYDSLEKFCEDISMLQRNIGLPCKLSAYGIKKEDIEILVEESFHPNILNNPREVTKRDLFEIYSEIL